ncbi:MAG: DUF177 domain-containing protein [Microcoleaceae cyanobacterium]
MEPIYIPHLLKSSNRTVKFEFSERLPSLDALTPVRGRMQVFHQFTFLEVKAQAETIVTLTCCRCLNQYNHRLTIDKSEIIWLDNTAEHLADDSLEDETDLEDLVETLSTRGHFEPDDWLYQHLCLELPMRPVCDGPCEVPTNPLAEASNQSEAAVDHRWAALAKLKQNLQ